MLKELILKKKKIWGIKQNIDDINVKDIKGNNDNLIEENME